MRKNGTNKGGERKERRHWEGRKEELEEDREDGKELEIREGDKGRWRRRTGRCSHGRT